MGNAQELAPTSPASFLADESVSLLLLPNIYAQMPLRAHLAKWVLLI